MDFTNEVTMIEDGKAMVYRSVESPFPFTGRYEVSVDDEGTRFDYHLETTDAGGFFGKIADPASSRMYAWQVSTDLGNLKDLIEMGS